MGFIAKYFNERKRNDEISIVFRDGVIMTSLPTTVFAQTKRNREKFGPELMSRYYDEIIKHKEKDLPIIYSKYKHDPEILHLVETADNIKLVKLSDFLKYGEIIKQIGKLIQKNESRNILFCKPYTFYFMFLLFDGPTFVELIGFLGVMATIIVIIV